MKRFLLITAIIIAMLSTGLTGVGCSTMATTQPVKIEFMGSDFEISLPEKWEGAKKEDLDSIIKKLKEADQEQLADEVEANKFYLLFFGYDSEAAELGSDISRLTITGESADFLSIDECMELEYTNIEKLYEEAEYKFEIIEQDIVPLGNYKEVGRTIFEQAAEGVETKSAQYIIKHEIDFWVLTFTAKPEQFDLNIQNFDKTIETFKIAE